MGLEKKGKNQSPLYEIATSRKKKSRSPWYFTFSASDTASPQVQD
jgi:hypothetical protein